jgi:hypothetical protein
VEEVERGGELELAAALERVTAAESGA